MNTAKLFRILLGITFFIIAGFSFFVTGMGIIWGALVKGHITETISYIGWNSIFFLSSCTGIYVAIRLIKRQINKITGILMVVALIPLFIAFILPAINWRQILHAPYSKAIKYFSQGEYGLAIEEFNMAKGLTGDKKPYQELITTYIKNGDFDSALKVCNEYSEQPSKLRGGLYFWRGDYEAAINEYQAIAKRAEEAMERPGYRLLIALANSYARLGNDILALETFNKAIELTKQQNIQSYSQPDVTAIISKGDFYLWKGQFEKAMTEYNKAIEVHSDPYYNLAYEHRAYLFTMLKDYNSAVNDLSKLISTPPSYTKDYMWCRERAYLFDKLGMYEKAKEDMEVYNRFIKDSYYNDGSRVLWKEVDKIRDIPPLIEVFEDIGK